MGGFQFKPFERNDSIVGQGKEVLLFSKAVHINTYEVNRIFFEFQRLEDPATHLVEIVTIFNSTKKKLKPRLFDELLYQFFDDHKTGRLSFLEYIVIQWAFLTTDDQLLAILCFSMFDPGK
jgi:hypothetical protein